MDQAGSIIIPANNEEAVILRTLNALRPLVEQGLVEIIVACNGCTDNTAGVAASVDGIRVIETDPADKTAALNLADAAASTWPRLYLDADVQITPDAALEVLGAVADGGALAARPEFHYITTGASAIVRAYFRARDRLSGTRGALWGAGAFALSEQGHARFGAFPTVTADDLFVDRKFQADEKRYVRTTPVRVAVPQRASNLISVLRRHTRGTRELAMGATSTSTVRQLLRSVRGPISAFDAAVYTAFALIARGMSRMIRSESWERDDSSRAPAEREAQQQALDNQTMRTPIHESQPPTQPQPRGSFAGPNEPVDVAAVVVTYESRRFINGLLNSLRAETDTHSIRAIVVDNASRDGTLKQVRMEHPDVVALATGRNLGYAGAINAASKFVKPARAILVINPDTIIAPGCIAAMLARLERSAGAAVVPQLRGEEGTRSHSIRREPTLLGTLGDTLFGARLRKRPKWLSETVFTDRAYDYAHPVDWATGAAILIDGEVAQRIGAWDERYFLFSEEIDYFRRIREAGGTIWYEPAAHVTHRQGGSGFSPRLNALSAVNRIRYARRFHGSTYVAVFWAIAILAEILRMGRADNRGTLGMLLSPARWPQLPGNGVQPSGNRAQPVTFGYLVPEFPGQTHAFFWREVQKLRTLGAQPHIVSTRRLPREALTHTWTESATTQTHYLVPGSPRAVITGAALMGAAILRGRAIQLIREVRPGLGVSLPRVVALAFAGAELAALARRRGWQHLHVHSCADSAWVAFFAHRLAGLPYSLTAHGPLSDYGDGQTTKWSRAEFGFAITGRVRDEIRRELNEHAPRDVAIAPMGVDPDRFARRSPYQPWEQGTTARIFSCGRLNPGKAHDDMVRAIAVLVEQGRDVELVIAGQDDNHGEGYRHWLEGFIATSGVADRVTLLGAASEDLVHAELERAHVFALASHAEPLGVAIMEAMAMCLPVVVNAGGGVDELIEDGVTGILANARDPKIFAGAIASVLDRPDVAATLGRNARDSVVNHFTSTRSAAILLDRIRRHTSPARTEELQTWSLRHPF